MNDEQFFERLRYDARHLRHEPDDITVSRIKARIRARAAAPPNVSQLLAGWLRPVAAAIAAVVLTAALSLTWFERRQQDTFAVDQIAANTTEISVEGVNPGGVE
jgi:hypothetical protein